MPLPFGMIDFLPMGGIRLPDFTVLTEPQLSAAARPRAGAVVMTGRPARIQAMAVLGKSHRFVCTTSITH